MARGNPGRKHRLPRFARNDGLGLGIYLTLPVILVSRIAKSPALEVGFVALQQKYAMAFSHLPREPLNFSPSGFGGRFRDLFAALPGFFLVKSRQLTKISETVKSTSGGMMTSPLQQKLRLNGPVVITANRLGDGSVVHRTQAGGWTADLSRAEVLATAGDVQIALEAASADGSHAVGAYAAPVTRTTTGIAPGNLREAIRTGGPTFALPGADMEPLGKRFYASHSIQHPAN